MTTTTPTCRWAAESAIDEVLDETSGAHIPAATAIGSDRAAIHTLRMDLQTALRRETGRYLCPLCTVPVYLVAQPDGEQYFFRHQIEDGSCSKRTRGLLSLDEIAALKYHGQRESLAHRLMKQRIVESLRCDPRFGEPVVERSWRGLDGALRRPDVRARYEDRADVAFEAQLSTTFLQVMAGRREFYLRQGGLLFWILPSFDGDESVMTYLDVFYNNNQNVFIVNDATLAASQAQRRFVLDVRYARPELAESRIVSTLERQLVGFDELTLDLDRQQAYFFDTAGSQRRAASDARAAADQALRDDFARLFEESRTLEPGDRRRQWSEIAERMREREIYYPLDPTSDDALRALLIACYSAERGAPVVLGFRKLIEVGHRLFEHHKGALWAWRAMLRHHDRAQQLRDEDKRELWMRKVREWRAAERSRDPRYEPDHRFDTLLAFLFPAIAAALGRDDS